MKHWFRDQHFVSLFRNTSYLALSKGVAAVASLASLALAGRALGLELFGLLILITSYAQAAGNLAKFQSWQLIIRYGAPALAAGDPGPFRRALGFALGLDLVSGIGGMIVAIAILPFLGPWFGLPDNALKAAMLYCLLLPTMAAATPTGILRSLDRFDLISWQATFTPLSRVVLVAAAWSMGLGFNSFVLIWALTDLGGDLFFWFLAIRELRRRDHHRDIRPTLRPVGMPGAWSFAAQVNLTSSLNAAWGPIARLIIGGLLGPASAALYRVAASITDAAQKPADLLGQTFYPEVVKMDLATGKPWRLLLRGMALAGAIGLLAIAIVALGGRPLIGATFGSKFLGAYPVLLVMIGVPLLTLLAFPLPPMLYALHRPDGPLIARLAGTIAYFAVVAPLATRFDVAGAAVAYVLGNAVLVATLAMLTMREYRRVRGTRLKTVDTA